MARSDIPKITWGGSFANTLDFGYPIDRVVTFSDPRPGFQIVRTPAGEADSWYTGEDFILEGIVKWIPTSDGTTPYGEDITGWDGSTGWRAFLAWARAQNEFRFYPDKDTGTYKTCALLDPIEGAPGLDQSTMTRNLRIAIVTTDSEFTGY